MILVQQHLEAEVLDLDVTMPLVEAVVVVAVAVLLGEHLQDGVDLVAVLDIAIVRLEPSWVMEFLEWDTMVDGEETIPVELQTTLVAVVAALLKMVKIIEKDLTLEMAEMDYLLIFLAALFIMELVVAVVFTPMVMVELVDLVVVAMAVTILSQVKSTKEVLLLDMETAAVVVDTPTLAALDLVES
jgi:hypothetical protein